MARWCRAERGRHIRTRSAASRHRRVAHAHAAGSYTVRATSHWVITWSGIGQSGTITMDLTDSVPVTIGEAQVLKQ